MTILNNALMTSAAKLATEPAASPLPAYMTIDDWCAFSSMGRRLVYDRLGRGELKAVKCGSRTLVDVAAGLNYLRALPPAKIRPDAAALRRRRQGAAAEQHAA